MKPWAMARLERLDGTVRFIRMRGLADMVEFVFDGGSFVQTKERTAGGWLIYKERR